jgi:hypothetical protein
MTSPTSPQPRQPSEEGDHGTAIEVRVAISKFGEIKNSDGRDKLTRSRASGR